MPDPVIRILHFEDDTKDAELIRAALESGNFKCEFLSVDSREGYEDALSRGGFDLILSDYRIPGFDGLSALFMAQDRRPEIPFIFVSGTIGEELAIQTIQLGATDYVLKDKPARLTAAISRALQDVRTREERRRAEELLRQSEEQFRAMTENMADLVAVLDLQGKRLYNSPSYRNLLGDPDDLEGTNSFAAIHPEDRSRIEQIFSETVRSGQGQRTEYRMIAKDGTIHFIESQASVIRDEHGAPARLLVVSRDVSDRKVLEEQLLQAQKMEGIGTLAGGIAHDFNNILSIILGYASMLKKGGYEASQLPRSIDAIVTAAERGSTLVRQLLTFARKSDVVFSNVDVNRLIEDVVGMCTQTFPRTISFVTDLDPHVASIPADRNQLHQALLNLCVNARDAMPQGGSISVGTHAMNAHEIGSLAAGSQVEQYVCLSVTDTGTGMDEATKARIFEPFFTTKAEGKGTGLGLSIVYGVVKSHHALLDVKSELNRGTQFRLYFPLATTGTETSRSHDAVPEEVEGGKETILVVEDEDQISSLVTFMLESKGYHILLARDGIEGLEMFEKHLLEIDLVLTDVGLPRLDGWQMILRMKQLKPGLLAIVATGYSDQVSRSKMLEDGVKNVLQKPYAPNVLLQAVRKVLDGAPNH
jgi:two-component system cell cycle sensor histidine kinase/response regulator CckA